ncbi:MAG: PTS mannose transporter subunit IIAB [Candidatus Eisenbacteria bacterium]|nr:PTS mannose transporter subunit IIAB [Candidatus Eisenbacteria bacterium]
MVQALIVAHGDLARALLETVESLTGPQPGVRALSNRDCNLPDLVERIREAAGAMGPGPLFIFADLLGGSCSQAARMVVEGRPEWRLVTGVSVPMLVNFFQNRDTAEPARILELLVDRARAGVRVFPEGGDAVDPRPAG